MATFHTNIGVLFDIRPIQQRTDLLQLIRGRQKQRRATGKLNVFCGYISSHSLPHLLRLSSNAPMLRQSISPQHPACPSPDPPTFPNNLPQAGMASRAAIRCTLHDADDASPLVRVSIRPKAAAAARVSGGGDARRSSSGGSPRFSARVAQHSVLGAAVAFTSSADLDPLSLLAAESAEAVAAASAAAAAAGFGEAGGSCPHLASAGSSNEWEAATLLVLNHLTTATAIARQPRSHPLGQPATLRGSTIVQRQAAVALSQTLGQSSGAGSNRPNKRAAGGTRGAGGRLALAVLDA